MIVTVLAPEVLITLNSGQLAWALQKLEELKRFAEEDGVPWSLTHSLFANMGGFVVREFTPDRSRDLLPLDTSKRREGNGIVESQVINIAEDRAQNVQQVPAETTDSATEGAEISPRTDSNTTPDGIEEFENTKEGNVSAAELLTGSRNALLENVEGQPHAKPRTIFLTTEDVLVLREKGIIRLPYITRDEIMDKGKSDSFARVMAICQTLWLVVQMLMRSGRHLDVSQLEIGTTAFAFCAIVIYALNWHKPKNVGVPWTLYSFAGRMPDEMLQVLPKEFENEWVLQQLFSPWNSQKPRASFISNSHRYFTMSREPVSFLDAELIELSGFMLTSTTFGAIHFAAIKLQFPSYIEWLLWCVASAICTSISLLVLFALLLAEYVSFLAKHTLSICNEDLEYLVLSICNRGLGISVNEAKVKLVYLMCLIYILARLFLIVELFRCLFFLPTSAFLSTWVSSVPHVS